MRAQCDACPPQVKSAGQKLADFERSVAFQPRLVGGEKQGRFPEPQTWENPFRENRRAKQ
jgi:hypothetical protein